VSSAIVSDRDQFLEALVGRDLARATALYGGPFFPEFGSPGAVEFEHWVEAERERLRILFFQAAEATVRAALDRSQARDVLDLAQRIRTEAPDSEAAARLLLEVHLALHDRPAAAVEAERVSQMLAEHGRRPELATTRLLRLVHEGQPGDLPEPDTSVAGELVGREREFHLLVRAWRAVAGQSARLIHIEGRAGIGKTRLLREAADRILALGGRLVMIRAEPGERALPSAFAADLARGLAALPGAMGVSARTASLLVGLHPGLGSVYPGAIPESGVPSQLPQRALALGDLLAAVSDDAPVALLLDDVHWMDQESAQIVGAVLARLQNNSLLVVTAGRPGPTAFVGDADRMLLAPLGLADTQALLASIAAFPSAASGRRLAAAVHQATGGSPLLILEALQLALEQGRLQRSDGAWSLPDEEGLQTWLATLRPVEGRLESLSTPARQLLLTLAATGAPLAQAELMVALGSGLVSANTITELERRGYLAVREDRWNLAHDEVGAAVVRLASDAERKQAHAALGRALLDAGVQDPRKARRAARHLLLGRADADLSRLFRLWVQTARDRGDWGSVAALGRELLGELWTAETAERLARDLPWVVRFPVVGRLFLHR